jgi:tRNA(Ile2) C34 agmatinyltransferase TiaS
MFSQLEHELMITKLMLSEENAFCLICETFFNFKKQHKGRKKFYRCDVCGRKCAVFRHKAIQIFLARYQDEYPRAVNFEEGRYFLNPNRPSIDLPAYPQPICKKCKSAMVFGIGGFRCMNKDCELYSEYVIFDEG